MSGSQRCVTAARSESGNGNGIQEHERPGTVSARPTQAGAGNCAPALHADQSHHNRRSALPADVALHNQ
jgi:hypothetical protein